MKRKLFWIVYLVVATLCATLFLIIFQEYRTFGLSSLFLIVMLPLFIYLMWVTSPFTTVKETEWHRFQTKILHLRYDKQLKFHEDVTEKRDDISQELNKSFFVVHLGLLFVCPAVFVCIFLFSHIIKIIVLGVPFVLLIYCAWFISLKKLRKINRQRFENELQERREQEKREELGNWK